jgi:hypothetical protein
VALDGVVFVPVDCATATPVANASANAASDPALKTFQAVLMNPPPARPADHAASLHSLDASILLFGNKREE